MSNETTPMTSSQRAAATKARLEAKKEAKAKENIAALDKLIDVVQIIRQVRPAMTLNQVLVFLEIAKGCQGSRGKIENLEVRMRTGLETSSLAAIVKALSLESHLGKGMQKDIEGLGLVEVFENDADGRAIDDHLTSKGKELSKKIINKML